MCLEESDSCESLLPFANIHLNIVQVWGRRSSQFARMQKRPAENQHNGLTGICWACSTLHKFCMLPLLCQPASPQRLHKLLLQQQFCVIRKLPGVTLGSTKKTVKSHTPLLPNCEDTWNNLTQCKDLKHRKAALIKKKKGGGYNRGWQEQRRRKYRWRWERQK